MFICIIIYCFISGDGTSGIIYILNPIAATSVATLLPQNSILQSATWLVKSIAWINSDYLVVGTAASGSFSYLLLWQVSTATNYYYISAFKSSATDVAALIYANGYLISGTDALTFWTVTASGSSSSITKSGEYASTTLSSTQPTSVKSLAYSSTAVSGGLLAVGTATTGQVVLLDSTAWPTTTTTTTKKSGSTTVNANTLLVLGLISSVAFFF